MSPRWDCSVSIVDLPGAIESGRKALDLARAPVCRSLTRSETAWLIRAVVARSPNSEYAELRRMAMLLDVTAPDDGSTGLRRSQRGAVGGSRR